jgi:hypothetical protein
VIKENRKLVVLLASAVVAAACSSSPGNGNPGAGGGTPGSAGSTGAAGNPGSGGSSTGTGGSTTGTGGSTTGTGGSTTGTGGSATGTGGSATGTGGSTTGTGGSAAGTGGSATGTAGRGGNGGSATGTAGSTAGAGGSAAGAGGSAAGTGGSTVTIGPGGAPPTCTTPAAVGGSPGSVDVATATTVRASVSADFFGIHTSVYDGGMQNSTTPDLLKTAGVTSLRWPGGSYADLYHWSTNLGTWTPASGAGSNTIYIADNTDFGHFLLFMERVGAKALITVNYGTNMMGNGPGEPKEAAAEVAYANGSPSSTQAIGADSKGNDWKTVGYWATLRAAASLPTDDGFNKFRINHAAPFAIQYWEIGNELYGNGYYYGACGWEADMHAAYPPAMGTTCTGRQSNSALSPGAYGTAVKAYADAMKAVDPSVRIGGIVVGTSDTEYTNPDWNSMVLSAGCSKMDFVSLHWYAPATTKNITIQTVSTVPELEIPATFTRVRTALTANNCPGGANMPLAITEWGPNTNSNGITGGIPTSTVDHAPVGSQVLGLFAAEAYANFLEQGALATHWLELHNNSYLAGVDATNDPFTMLPDSPRWGWKGEVMAHFLAMGGDKIVKATTSTTGFGTQLKSHAAVHGNGDFAVMITNTNRNNDAQVTVNVTGMTIGCVGKRYVYSPVNTDQDGTVSGDWLFAPSAGTSVQTLVPRYSTVVLVFPKK